MSLEARAARAARSLRSSVSAVSPVPLSGIVRRHRTSLAGVLAGALGAMALALVGFGAMWAGTADEGLVAQPAPEPPLSTATTLPAPPPLAVGGSEPLVPADGVFQVTGISAEATPHTAFIGLTAPGTLVSAYSEFGSASTVADAGGWFRLELVFTDPPYGVEFPVTVTAGLDSFAFTFKWTWDPTAVAITAHQTHGSSSSSSPYEVYYGTAPPGTEITAVSAYGSGETTADEKGAWTLKVFFSGAPSGQAFPVTVTVGTEAFQFSFTSHFSPASASFSVVEVHKDEGQGQWMKFLVSGAPGTTVQATSPYGNSNVVTIDGKGQAWVKVLFSGAPLGEAFTVRLKVDGADHPVTYSFTSQWDPQNTPITIEVHKDEAHPYVKVWGTAPPGTSVSVSSPHGSASGSAGSDGKYLVKVELKSPLPQAGEPFDVTITVGDQVQVHSFTYTPK